MLRLPRKMFKFFAFLVLVTLCNVTCKKLPSYITPCRRSVGLKECLASNIEKVRPHLKKGVRELGVPPLDPLVLPFVKTETATFRYEDRYLILRGVQDFVLKEVDLEVDNGLLKVTVDLPDVGVEANYSMEGSVFDVQVSGSGYCEGHVRDLRLSMTLKGNPKHLDGKEYMTFDLEKFKMLLYGRKTYAYFRDLVQGSQELTDAANEVLNSRMNEFMYLIEPMVKEVFGGLFVDVVNTVFSRYSLDELFVD